MKEEYLNYLSSHIEYEHILLDIADMFDKDSLFHTNTNTMNQRRYLQSLLTELTVDQLERLAKLYDY
jgi:hypothetical protein